MLNFFKLLIIFNFLLSFVVIFYEKDNFLKLMKWYFICTLFPCIGFISYIVLGNKLKFKEKKKIINHKVKTEDYIKLLLSPKITNFYQNYLWKNNKVDYFLNQYDFLQDFINEIKKAKKSINIQFYIFTDDHIGNFVAHHLINKAKEGIKIKILYDHFGSGKTSKDFWNRLKNNNIEVVSFLPAKIGNHIFNFKINYRNHRKIIVIDGKTSYLGGINLRNDHFGLDKKIKPWIDCMIKIKGYGTYKLQDTFLNDFYYASDIIPSLKELKGYFPNISTSGNIDLKIINGDPTQNENKLLNEFLFHIQDAHKFVFICSPYFIISKEYANELITLINKKVEVKIFIPKIPDKKLIYSATLNCLKQLFSAGAKIYLVDGFLHAKIFATENVISIGSCNFDNRSLNLNFETNCFCYDKVFINKFLTSFYNIKNIPLTKNKYKKLRAKYFHLLLISKLLFKIL